MKNSYHTFRSLSLIIFLSFLQFSICYAQNQIDSVKNIQYVEDWGLRLNYDYFTTNRAWTREAVKNRFNNIDLQGRFDKGSLIQAQGASQIKQLNVKTEGKIDFDRLSVWGRFRYIRSMEDSTQLRHQTRNNMDAPVYFGSLRKNYYERDIYEINGLARYDFLNGKLPVGISFDYHLGNHFSNNDPRGRVADFQFDNRLFIGYKFENWDIYLTGLYGYGRERVGVGYKNDKNLNNTSDPLYINWYMNGFGRSIMKVRDMNYNDDFRKYGVGFMASRTFGSGISVYSKLEYIHEKQAFKFYDSSPKTYQMLNEYNRNSLMGDFLLSSSKQNTPHYSSYRLNFDITRGEDYNYEIYGNNYVFQQQVIDFSAVQHFGQAQIEFGLGYDSKSYQDGSMGIQLDYQNLNPKIKLGYLLHLAENQSMIPNLGFGIGKNLTNTFNYPTISPGAYTDAIILANYQFYTTTNLQYNFGLDYQIKEIKGYSYRIGLQADYIRRNDQNANSPYYIAIGRDRLNTRLNLSVYF